MTKRILYVQHAGSLGGSCMSLLYLIQGLDRSKYEPVVACIYNVPQVLDLYWNNGIETLYWPGITPFEHTTLGWGRLYDPLGVNKLLRQIIHFSASAKASERLVAETHPDVVHLNSLVLAPSAIGAKHTGVPLVWHVREPVHPGHFGIRRRLLSRLFMRLADEGIFISEFDRQQLTGGQKGVVVHNFVDFNVFDHTIDGAPVRAELNLPPDAKLILFLGGQSVVKGIFPLLQAMPIVRESVPNIHLAIGGGAYRPSGRSLSRAARSILPRIGSGTVSQRVDKLIKQHRMQDHVHLLEWRKDIPQLLAACDVLVFPSIEPHFARPVIEAGAMKRPVVASRIGGVEELVKHERTGLLVSPNDSRALAGALVRVLVSPGKAHCLGEEAYVRAHHLFDAQINICSTVTVYEGVLSL